MIVTGFTGRALVTWAGNCVGLLLASAVFPAVGYSHDAGKLLLAGAVLGIVNLALRPLLVVMTLPAVILTLGLSLLLVNTLMLWLTSEIVSGLSVGGFWTTLGGALVIALVNMALHRFTGTSRWSRLSRLWAGGRRLR